jgi:hypothetical protein
MTTKNKYHNFNIDSIYKKHIENTSLNNLINSDLESQFLKNIMMIIKFLNYLNHKWKDNHHIKKEEEDIFDLC